MATTVKSLRALCMLAVMAGIISIVVAAPLTPSSGNFLKRKVGSQNSTNFSMRGLVSRTSSGADGKLMTRVTSTVEVEFKEDDAEEDPHPSTPAHVWKGTEADDDGITDDNPEDYNKEDLEAAEKALVPIKKDKRGLFKRSPVNFRSIGSGATTLKYVAAYLAQPSSKQVIFYSKMVDGGLKFYKSTRDKWTDPDNKLQIEHVLEIQRVKSYFKREMPAGVKDVEWKKMQVAVDDATNSDTNEAKKKLGNVINAVANLRGFQGRPNMLKGKVCTNTDKTSSGLPHASKGPNWADKWTRGEAWTALQYITSTSRQYAASVTSICKTVEELTKDDILVADLKKELLASLVTDKKTLKTQLDKPIGKAGVVFKEEDMPPAPKV